MLTYFFSLSRELERGELSLCCPFSLGLTFVLPMVLPLLIAIILERFTGFTWARHTLPPLILLVNTKQKLEVKLNQLLWVTTVNSICHNTIYSLTIIQRQSFNNSIQFITNQNAFYKVVLAKLISDKCLSLLLLTIITLLVRSTFATVISSSFFNSPLSRTADLITTTLWRSAARWYSGGTTTEQRKLLFQRFSDRSGCIADSYWSSDSDTFIVATSWL